MAALDHERHRLYQLVDEFIEAYSDELDDELRVDQPMLVGVLHYTRHDADGDEVEREAVVYAAESKRRYVQIGVLDRALHQAHALADPD